MDMISAISNMGSMSPYRITSINGNPNSLAPIEKVGEKNSRKNKALVIAAEEKEKDLYVKDYGELPNTTRMQDGAFAEVLQKQADSMSGEQPRSAGSMVAFYNDSIGMMGFANGIRSQLTGSAFTPITE